jgi:hypothetical protein
MNLNGNKIEPGLQYILFKKIKFIFQNKINFIKYAHAQKNIKRISV